MKGVENLSAQEFLVLRGLTHLRKGDSIFLDTSDEVIDFRTQILSHADKGQMYHEVFTAFEYFTSHMLTLQHSSYLSSWCVHLRLSMYQSIYLLHTVHIPQKDSFFKKSICHVCAECRTWKWVVIVAYQHHSQIKQIFPIQLWHCVSLHFLYALSSFRFTMISAILSDRNLLSHNTVLM